MSQTTLQSSLKQDNLVAFSTLMTDPECEKLFKQAQHEIRETLTITNFDSYLKHAIIQDADKVVSKMLDSELMLAVTEYWATQYKNPNILLTLLSRLLDTTLYYDSPNSFKVILELYKFHNEHFRDEAYKTESVEAVLNTEKILALMVTAYQKDNTDTTLANDDGQTAIYITSHQDQFREKLTKILWNRSIELHEEGSATELTSSPEQPESPTSINENTPTFLRKVFDSALSDQANDSAYDSDGTASPDINSMEDSFFKSHAKKVGSSKLSSSSFTSFIDDTFSNHRGLENDGLSGLPSAEPVETF